jgi:16S rRNA processing protein RimM
VYEADLVGLAAVGKDGRDWGKVVAFHDFGAGSVMEVSGGVIVPFNDEAVPEIDVEGGKVVIDPPAGLLTGGKDAGGKEKEAET